MDDATDQQATDADVRETLSVRDIIVESVVQYFRPFSDFAVAVPRRIKPSQPREGNAN